VHLDAAERFDIEARIQLVIRQADDRRYGPGQQTLQRAPGAPRRQHLVRACGQPRFELAVEQMRLQVVAMGKVVSDDRILAI